ncbi:hypothetical protein ID866_5203 [Astraeus odoratus]|nr:hypothetical protein ID866_5203 [Astraeus odoratus]
MMKSLRKSFNGNKDTHRLQISTPLPLPSISKPLSASLPPQKVIRAIKSFSPTAPTQLPFEKGDFFYVTGDPDNFSPWYEAHNPVSGARGLVPKDMFEEFCKSPNPLRASRISVTHTPVSPLQPKSPKAPKTGVFYAVVLHDFVAERTDELDAKAGDPISVVAQSNREWFVAKPIGRLGRPGLIPAAFVEVRDPMTNLPISDIDALIDRGDLPKVEDWKKAMINYKQNSIPLGVIEDEKSPVSNNPYATSPPTLQTQPPTAPPSIPLPDGILLSASVVSFHYEMSEYWFRIDAIFQPYSSHGPSVDASVLPKAKQLVLFRPYQEFHDFQIKLLDTFPREAGREPPAPRILPFMPGQVEEVNDEVTAIRRGELDAYLRDLCALSSVGAAYILQDQLVREFLALKPGDVEQEVEPRYEELQALFAEDGNQEAVAPEGGYSAAQDFEEEVRHTFGEMRLSYRDDRSEGSYYGEDPTTQALAHSQNHCGHQYSNPTSSFSPHDPYPPASSTDAFPENGASRGSVASSSQLRENHPSSPSSQHSSQPSSRSRSHSVVNTNLNNPPMSAGNPQTAFIRIKIFSPDELIAIRVHPRVTYYELVQKLQSRLGVNINALRYRDSSSNKFIGLENDQDLRDWLDSTEKHVLLVILFDLLHIRYTHVHQVGGLDKDLRALQTRANSSSHPTMVSIIRYVRNIRRTGIKQWWHQMQYIGDAKAGTLVGMDQFGNKYYENLNPDDEVPGRHRWVDFAQHYNSATQVPAEWHSWLQHIRLLPPTEDKVMQNMSPPWKAPWVENLTGTRGAYRPYNTVAPKISTWESKVTARE